MKTPIDELDNIRDKVIVVDENISPEFMQQAIRKYNFVSEDPEQNRGFIGLFEYYKNLAPLEPGPLAAYIPDQINRVKWVLSKCQGAKNILDIGVSQGYVEEVYPEATALEISKRRLLNLKQYVKCPMVNAVAEYLPFKKKTFDLVILAEVLEHVIEPERVLKEALEVLTDDGKIIITVPDEFRGHFPRNIEHLHHFTRESLSQLLDKFNLDYVMEDIQSGPFMFIAVEAWRKKK